MSGRLWTFGTNYQKGNILIQSLKAHVNVFPLKKKLSGRLWSTLLLYLITQKNGQNHIKEQYVQNKCATVLQHCLKTPCFGLL